MSNAPSNAVKLVSPDIERCYPRTTDAEYESQISFNHGAVNRVPGFRRERADFICAELIRVNFYSNFSVRGLL